MECQRKAAAKALRAANRSRRRRQELWEQEVYGGGSYAGSNTALRTMMPLSHSHQTDSVHDRRSCSSSALIHSVVDGSNNSHRRSGGDVAPSFEMPTRAAPAPHRTSRPTIPAAEIASSSLGRVTPPLAFAPLVGNSINNINNNVDTDIEMSRLESPTSAPISQNGFDDDGDDDDDHDIGVIGEEFVAIGAYTGRARGGGGAASMRDGSLDEDATRISSWGRNGPDNTGAAMSWVAGEEDGGGRITPKTALRFKTSALARAMHR